ncbi:hypothetical protein HWV62_22630 [Athelia sp. TMB]|nr:hypothetical protein HWV62_22630 [Athelia sp. TMB]
MTIGQTYILGRAEYGSATFDAISGEDEAAYGWVAANSLLGAFNTEYRMSARDTVGYLEMGGQSAQIAFRPLNEVLEAAQLHTIFERDQISITTIELGGQKFDLFLKTWELGSNQAWRTYQQRLIDETLAGNVTDPHSPRGRIWKSTADPSRIMVGGGTYNSVQFHNRVLAILNPHLSEDDHLLSESLLTLLRTRRFVGGGNFWYSTRLVFGRNLDGTPKATTFSFREYLDEVQSTTNMSWTSLQLRLRNKYQDVMGNSWFVAEWVRCVLVEGLQFNIDDNQGHETQLSFRPFGGVGKADLTWTLGKAILYANRPDGQPDYTLKTISSISVLLNRYVEKSKAARVAKANREEEKLYDNIVHATSFEEDSEDELTFLRAAEANAKHSRSLRRGAKQTVAENEGQLVGPAVTGLARAAIERIRAEEAIRLEIMEQGENNDRKERLKLAQADVQGANKALVLAVKKAAGSLPATATVNNL